MCCQDFYNTKLFYDFLMLWWQIYENECKMHRRKKIKPRCRICIDKEESVIALHWRQHKHRVTFRRIIFAKHQYVSHASVSNMSLLNQRGLGFFFFRHVEEVRNVKQIVTLPVMLFKKNKLVYIIPLDQANR